MRAFSSSWVHGRRVDGVPGMRRLLKAAVDLLCELMVREFSYCECRFAVGLLRLTEDESPEPPEVDDLFLL